MLRHGEDLTAIRGTGNDFPLVSDLSLIPKEKKTSSGTISILDSYGRNKSVASKIDKSQF